MHCTTALRATAHAGRVAGPADALQSRAHLALVRKLSAGGETGFETHRAGDRLREAAGFLRFLIRIPISASRSVALPYAAGDPAAQYRS